MNHRALLLGCALIAAACERAKTPVTEGRARLSIASTASTSPAATVATKPWDDELGALLATPSLDGGTPVLFARDTSATAESEIELFTHDDHTTKATLRPGTVIRSCAWRRNASLITADGRAVPGGWSLALAPGIATPIGIDGVSELLPRDSAATVARVSRLVSAIPEDSSSALFRGLPIVVREAWRFQLADPRAQAIILIAEPEPASNPVQWRTAFWEMVAGAEERVEGMDLLAALQLHGSKPAVAIVREGDAGLQVEIVERTAPGVWGVHWSSVSLPCANP